LTSFARFFAFSNFAGFSSIFLFSLKFHLFFRIPHYDKTNTTPQTRKKLFALAKGQTAQLRINERVCEFDDTYYTQYTYNFAYADNVPREIFTQRDFDHSVSLENHLF
jgi:hypothetical protein